MRRQWKLVFAFAVATMLLASGEALSALAAPTNDNFANATSVPSLPFNSVVNTADSTTEPGEPQVCNFMSQTVWYSFTPSTNTMVSADNSGTAFATGLNVYQASGPGLFGLNFLGCAQGPNPVTFSAQAGTTYYIQTGILFGAVGDLHVNLHALPAPANDNFANPKLFTSVPFTDTVDTTAATLEPGEPIPSCGFGNPPGTVWYAFTPTTAGTVSATTQPTNFQVAAYSGSSLTSLTELGCRAFGGLLTIPVKAGQTYYFQVGGVFGARGTVTLTVNVTPPPQANFFYSPFDPSMFDTVNFNDGSFDPGGLGIKSQAWSFGDGASATGCCVTHRFAADGDYTVTDTVSTTDGRTASATQTVHVRTHDVAITKFSVPSSASVGQTRQIVVGISSKRSQETVQVQLSRSTPSGFQVVGTLTQTVPVNPGNQTTPFTFDYSFTNDDASTGKVTFQATATIVGARDALPGDNTATATPTFVKP
jgi:hypothetical protein